MTGHSRLEPAEIERRLLLGWRAPAVRRVTVGVAAGGAVAVLAVVLDAPWQFSVLLGWVAAALVFLVLVWATISRFTAAQTSAMATLEDPSRRVSHFVLLAASTASLVSIAFGLHRANNANGALRLWMTVAVLVGVALAWLVVHTVYVLRYAHLYYSGADAPPVAPPATPPVTTSGQLSVTTSGPPTVTSPATGAVSGIVFPGGEAPDYLDFAYVAFTLGMTFQVSDNAFTSRPLRRAALAHCLLSYVFGAVIVAITINVVAGLV